MMNGKSLRCWIVLLCALLAWTATAQTNARPRIGLVLGGGGAKGIAHVGVLKVMEELRIPVDYVAGTSMGSIIGGLYASGMSPDEIEKTLKSMDWWDAMKDRPGRRDLFYRRKQDTERYLLDFEMGIKKSGIMLPRAAVAGQKLNYTLQTATLNTAAIEDFDRLHLPFRCVATDIKEGVPVILRSGNLAEAMRASMAVPGLFTPVTLDNRLLVDGGLVNNIPVDVVRAMGADIVIAVDVVGSDLEAQKARLETMTDLLARTYSILKRPMEVQQLAAADLVITPVQPDLSAGDFYRTDEFIVRGEKAAREVIDKLRAYGVDEAAFAAYLARQRRGPLPPARIGQVHVEDGGRLRESYLASHLRIREGEPLDPRVLRRDVDRLYGLGYFERVDYRIRPASNGVTDVEFRAQPKPWGPTYLHFGLRLQSDLENDSAVQMLFNVTATEINRFGAEWRTDFGLGESRRIETEFYQPLQSDSRLFLAARGLHSDEDQNAFRDEVLAAEYSVQRNTAFFDAGIRLDTYGELRAGLYQGLVDADSSIGDRDLPDFDADEGGVQSRLVIDKLDSGNFPRKGYYLDVKGRLSRESLGASVPDYDRLESVLKVFASTGPHTFAVAARFGSSLGTELPAYDDFLLGGFDSLAGYPLERFRGDYMAAGRLGYYYRLGMLSPSMGKGIYAGGFVDSGNTWDEADDIDADDTNTGGALVFALDTVLGPIYLAYGRGEDSDDQYFLSLGNRF